MVPARDKDHPAILTEEVEMYLEKIQRPRKEALVELERDAVKNDVPISGPVVGTTLSILAKCAKAENILEIGTATGYSGIWLARALGPRGKLTTIESDPERQLKAKKAFERAGLTGGRVEMILGDARKVVPKLAKSRRGKFDIIFNDVGEKGLYSELLDDCLLALRKGGILIVDDTLYRGVAKPSIKSSKAKVMRAFNKRIFADDRIEPEILTVGDGLTIAIKK